MPVKQSVSPQHQGVPAPFGPDISFELGVFVGTLLGDEPREFGVYCRTGRALRGGFHPPFCPRFASHVKHKVKLA
jgi:hypothetical protein